MKFLHLLFVAFLFWLPGAASAEEVTPDTLIKNVTREVLDIVRTDKDIQSGNTRKTLDLVETKIVPHFDFSHMARLAMARDWNKTTPAQQKSLTDEFRTLLVRTYSKALNEYKTQTIDFKPLKAKPGDTDVKVRTQINQPGSAKPITLDYYLEKQADGWKVYDIEVGGISLVTNYRDFFTSEVRQGGVDGLIKALQTKNASNEKAGSKK
jgi:phospholipid transport system substrate-binding protein